MLIFINNLNEGGEIVNCCVCNKNRKLYPLPGYKGKIICLDCIGIVEVCCVCHKKIGTLQLEDDSWECENCAQVMGELAPD